MASVECSNEVCKKMIGYDKNDNITVVASSNYIKQEDDKEALLIDCKCPRCKRHNYIMFK